MYHKTWDNVRQIENISFSPRSKSLTNIHSTGLWARNCATIQQVLILKFAFGPEKFQGLSRNELLELYLVYPINEPYQAQTVIRHKPRWIISFLVIILPLYNPKMLQDMFFNSLRHMLLHMNIFFALKMSKPLKCLFRVSEGNGSDGSSFFSSPFFLFYQNLPMHRQIDNIFAWSIYCIQWAQDRFMVS